MEQCLVLRETIESVRHALSADLKNECGQNGTLDVKGPLGILRINEHVRNSAFGPIKFDWLLQSTKFFINLRNIETWNWLIGAHSFQSISVAASVRSVMFRAICRSWLSFRRMRCSSTAFAVNCHMLESSGTSRLLPRCLDYQNSSI